ncbi:sacsin-like [Antedon mediterranea]|uniref:sacsin-like n=1 Tax=Antedon mediterranea TaxID=105859 RepID=UPI003AF9F898
MSDEDEGEDNFTFGQREPPLVDYVKQILRNYTGGQLLKELTQNADDAGAATVKFLYDGRQHGTDRLYHGEGIGDLSPYQGPALCAFNDATFRKNDWSSIQNLSRSGKKDDPTKVGRFGMGFVSVYHLTDIPSIVSGNSFAFMDPSEKLFIHEGRIQRGRKFHKNNDVFKDSRFSDTFAPYKHLFNDHPGLVEGESFSGAMFRFPLRNRPSVISEKTINGEELRKLFQLFVEDAKILLLFLKNISSISVGERFKMEKPLFSARLSAATNDLVKEKREEILSSIRGCKQQKQQFLTTFPMNIHVEELRENCVTASEDKWLVSVHLAELHANSEMLTLATEHDRLPLVGIAMQVFTSNVVKAIEGRTFCFLPLPAEENYSGLPVHVNADFGVSDDRRSIKWPLRDRNDKMSKWNQLLLQEVVPKTYTELIQKAIELHKTGNISLDCVYQTWPDMQKVTYPWNEFMCPELFKMLLKEKVFFTEACNGSWIDIDTAIFDLQEGIPEETQHLILQLLLGQKKPVVSIKNYPSVMKALENSRKRCITPKLVRDTLRGVSLVNLTSQEKINLLEYLLADDDFNDLQGFELLPLANGSFCKFASGETNVIFSVSSECSMDLLPGLSHKFIQENLKVSLKKKITDGGNRTSIKQVRELKPNIIPTLIKEALPRNWLNNNCVIWNPGKYGEPPLSWLEKFWTFLQRFWNDIHLYEGITLIPTNFRQNHNKIELVRFQRKSRLVLLSDRDPSFENLLTKLHLIPVNPEGADFAILPPSKGQQLYFHKVLPKDILRIFIEDGTSQKFKDDVDKLPADHVQLLRAFLKDIPHKMESEERNILLNISVFERATHVFRSPDNRYQSAVVNGSELKTVSKNDLPPFGFPTKDILLDISDEDSSILASRLRLQSCPREEALCQMIQGTEKDNDLKSLIIWIMERWHELRSGYKENIISEIKKKPFIPMQNGDHKRASDCFDPSDELLTKLFRGEDLFPTAQFACYREILLQLGLKTCCKVTSSDIIRCVNHLNKHPNEERAYALCNLLEVIPHVINDDRLFSCLQSHQWVPVVKSLHQSTYLKGFPLFKSTHILVSPNDVKSVKHASLVGSTLPLVLDQFTELSRRFYWESMPSPHLVYEHLQNVVNYVTEENQMERNVDTHSIESILHNIYPVLQSTIFEMKPLIKREDKWVWTGQCFVAPTKMSIEKTRHSLEPYIFVLPQGFLGYKRLFREFGASLKFDNETEQMLNLFEEIKDFHEARQNVTYERIDHDRDLAIQVIKSIIDLNKELPNAVRNQIFLPVSTPNANILEFASCDDVCFPNEKWLEHEEFEDIKLVHESVPPKIYQRLGVTPLGQKISGAMSLAGFQQAGQKENLTQKLRNILDSGYTEDSIAKEMIQNADDAGATEVKFMIDMRTNSELKSKLLDKNMKVWNGPALWVFNDATFSDADFENITKLGGRTKQDNQVQIGTFGLGFNSVYHITDVPSFLSRGSIGFLDPHTTFLDSQLRDKSNPGIRIDLNRSTTTLKRFKNQFLPYQGIFGCDILAKNKVNFEGTLFRLPLRQHNMGVESEISDKYFKEDNVVQLMKNVTEMSEKLLLFTQHVTQVSVCYLGLHQKPQDAVKLFSVRKFPKQYLQEINGLLKYQPEENKFEMQNTILREADQYIKQNNGTGDYPWALTEVCVEHCLTYEGAVQLHSTCAEFLNHWLVFTCMGQTKSLDLYEKLHGMTDTPRFKVPCGGVALPVQSILEEGEVFCFLPLSIPTSGIPCHINGNFAVSNDRHSLWKRNTQSYARDVKSDWNEAIMIDIITRSYVGVIHHDGAKKCFKATSLYDRWPDESKIPEQSEYFPLLKAFYTAIAYGIDDSGDKPCVFYGDDKWLNLESIAIYKATVPNSPITDDVKAVLQMFIPSEKHMVDIPEKILNGFKRVECKDLIDQYTEERFFKEIFFPNITKIQNKTRRNKLIMHVIDNSKNCPLYQRLLRNTNCIPTNSRLEKISSVVHPHGKVADLFEPEENRFPIKDFQTDRARMEVMVELGMIKDDLDMTDILERGRVFEDSKRSKQIRIKKIQTFMRLLERKRGMFNDVDLDKLSSLQIFPVLPRPMDFPKVFPWFGNECGDFVCAKKLFPSVHTDLVCFVRPIIDKVVFQNCGNSVLQMFNLSNQTCTPHCNDVIQQLKELSRIENKFLVSNESTVLRLCSNIYSHLERGSNEEIRELLNTDWPWIWSGEQFANTTSVCINEGKVNLSPYFFSVHRNLRKYKQLFEHCAVAMEQSERLSDLIQILHKIKDNHEQSVETKDDHKLVIDVLHFIKSHTTKEDFAKNYQNILIPIQSQNLKLVSPDECCFCDDWSKQGLDIEHDENVVHQDIPNAIASFFGVIPLSRKLSHSNQIGITQYGQNEPLTQRLHNILQDYQATDIPKEMIQNADDAEAKEVKFLIDLSENSNKKGLLDEGMTLCHGPALIVYNDAEFTQDDFENITKLGGQSKKEQTNKIGKFGLGFNSVYHITDVPSFISNGRLTIFDPQRFHLGNQIQSGAPGIQINFKKNPQTVERFSNQFQPYSNLFGWNFQDSYFTGTLFRLPLRTYKQVQKGGKISREVFDDKKIRKLISTFCEQAGDMLLFTKNVEKIKVYHRRSYDEQPECICSVAREGTRKDMETAYKIRITVDLKGQSTKEDWIIQPAIGTSDALQLANSPFGIKHGLNSHGGLAYKCNSKENFTGLVFCFLPLSIPSSGLPIHINAKFSVAPDRRSLRKRGSGDDASIHSESQWNNALMKDLISRGYVVMLSEPTSRSFILNDVSINNKENSMFSLWPRTDHVHTDIIHVVHCFYQAVVHGMDAKPPEIFKVKDNWYTFQEICFLDEELTNCHILPTVKEILERNGCVIVDLPKYIRKSFLHSKCSDALAENTISYQEFFEEQFFPHLAELPDSLVNKVVLFLLKHNDGYDWIDSNLKCLPCIPSTPNGIRKRPSELIDESCPNIASMYLPEDGRFPFGTEFKDQQISRKLCSLGMSHSVVPFEYIVERCKSIETLNQSGSTEAVTICQKRASAVLKYMDSISKEIEEHEVQRIVNIKFIPVEIQAPPDYPVRWANSSDLFLTPECVYISELVDCVGAVAPISKCLPCSKNTREILKMKVVPSLMDILKQLKYLVVADMTDSIKVANVQRMYKCLMKEIQISNSNEETTIRESLQDSAIVLCYGKFMRIKHVALRCKREFPPYLYKLPFELRSYNNIFQLLGMEEDFSYSTLLDISYNLQAKYTEQALEGRDLRVAIEMVQSIADCKSCEDPRPILVPDRQGYLRQVDQLSFCLHDTSDADIGEEILCHDLIPQILAACIGIKDIRSSVLLKHGSKLKYGKMFGQVQKLTNRIGEILKGYPCDDSIFKELLQNSDDAGADEINFIYDPRQHSDTKVFCDNWKETLGPALCVYNNKPFTEDDLKGIQDLGTGAKSFHPDKTGQYGIGFNSVYHLTDCPSFLTDDDTLCIFDPHCAFIDHATQESPGYQYDISPKVNEMFRDSLACFRLDSLKNKGSTLFRFPLRTSRMKNFASINQVPMSQELFDGDKIQSLLDNFESNAFQMLLYLNNLTKITISHIEKDSHMKTDYWVKAELSPEDKKRRHDFYNYVKECAKTSKLEDIQMTEVTYEMTISDKYGKRQVWLINQRIGSTEEIPASISCAYDEGSLKLLPRGGVAACISHKSSSTGTYCFLPLPIQVKLPVSINGHFSLDPSRRDLSNIMQNKEWNEYVKCQVIAHSYSQLLNKLRDGCFASDNGSASQITCSSGEMAKKMEFYWQYFPDIQNVHTDWKQLATQVFKDILQNQMLMFPVVRKTDGLICSKQETDNIGVAYLLKWLPAIGTNDKKVYFCPVNKPVFALKKLLFGEEEDILPLAILQHICFNITTVPGTVYNGLIEVGSQAAKHQVNPVEEVSPKAVVYFLKSAFNPGELPCDIISSSLQSEHNYIKLLKYIDKDRELQEGNISLNGMALLLTQDMQLRRFNETDTYFISRRYTLLPKSLDEFVYEKAQCHFSFKSCEIKKFCIEDLVERLPANLGPTYENSKLLWNPDGKEFPNKCWIQDLWKFLKTKFEDKKYCPNLNDNDKCDHIKHRMGNWSVLPVKVPTKRKSLLTRMSVVNHYLMPFSAAESVLHCHILDSTIKEACSKLSLPVVDNDIFQRRDLYNYLSYSISDDSVNFIKRFIATEGTPTRILTTFISLLDEDNQAFDSLNSYNRKEILLYFERFVGFSVKEEHIYSLKRLPCYRSIHNEFINLSQNKHHFVLHSGIPKVEKEKWVDEANAEFIEDDDSLKKLYGLLGLTKCSEPDVYKEFILPLFYKFTDEARVEHMTRIKQIVDESIYQRPVDKYSRIRMIGTMDLKNTPLVSHKDRPLKYIREYFDDSITIFKLMLQPEMLLPEPFCTYDWKQFMTELGLQTKATPQMVLEFGRKIEQRLNRFKFKEESEKSKALVNYIATTEELKTDKGFLSQMSGIAFLVPPYLDPNLLTLHKRYNEPGKVGVAYNGALTSQNVKLAWTSASILPNYAIPYVPHRIGCISFRDMFSDLNISETPSIDTVLQHTKNICTHLEKEYDYFKRTGSVATSPECKEALHEVMQKIYGYFSEKFRKSSEDCTCIVRQLIDVPILLVDHDEILTPVKYTVKQIKKDLVLTPYIHKIQESFVQYMDFFKHLGAEDKPSIWQCCELLKMVHEEVKDKSFHDNPNLMSMIKFAVRKIFKSHKDKGWLQGIDVLYLPNRSYQLMDSSTLKYYDKPMFEVRMKKENDKNILFNFTEIRLKDSPIIYIENMPTDLQPGKFSTQVKECMTSDPVESECRYAKEGLCTQQNIIQHQLQSSLFHRGVYRLLKHEANQQGLELTDADYSQKLLTLSPDHLTIKCLNNLKTHFQKFGDIIEGSTFEPHCFLERREDKATIFIRHDDSDDSDNFQILKLMLVEKVGELTGVLSNMEVALMICSDPNNIQKVLSTRNIQALDENKFKKMSLPELGSRVPDDVVESLNNHPFNDFRPGEYVVYEREDQDEVYVYAKVLRKISCNTSESSSLNRMYEIDYGKVKIVSTLSLYKWLSHNSNETSQDVGMDLQRYVASENNPLGSEETSVPQTYDNLDDTKSTVSDELEEIWKLEVQERKKAIKRLYLKWHPDKNPDHEEFCNEVFKHLKNEVDRLEKGRPRNSMNYYTSDFGTWDEPFRGWDERARRYRSNRYHFNSGSSPRYNFGSSSGYNFGSSSGFSGYRNFTSYTSTPSQRDAKLSQSQARHDFFAAGNDVDGSHPSYEWVAYKCLQAAEKSLKAAILSSTGGNYMTHDIRHLLITVEGIPNCPNGLRKHVSELCTHGKDQNTARYYWGNTIPHNRYSSEDANICISNAGAILDMMDTLIEGSPI